MKLLQIVYFRLRFGLVNTINTYLRLNICVLCVGDFKPQMCIILIPHTKSGSDLFLEVINL